MPIEVRRFGVGHRRPDGPPGTVGVTGQVIHSDRRGIIAELAFRRGASIAPHSNPNTTWFVVIEGGGWVGVGEERQRVQAGEAVRWPADVDHAAWTDHATMRAFVVEFAGASDAVLTGLLEGAAARIGPGSRRVARGEGRLVPREPATDGDEGDATAAEGEPR